MLTPEQQAVADKVVRALLPLSQEQRLKTLKELRARLGVEAEGNPFVSKLAAKAEQIEALTAQLRRDYADRDMLEAVKAIVFGDHGRWPEHADVMRKQFSGASLDASVHALVQRVDSLRSRLTSDVKVAETVPFLVGLLQWDRASRPHFALAPDFFHALTVTDYASKDDPTPLQLPFHAFTMAFPRSAQLGGASRLFVYRIPGFEGSSDIEVTWRRWRATLYPESGDSIFSQWEEGITRGAFAGGDPSLDQAPDGARVLGNGEHSFMRAARILVANVLSYIESKGPLPEKRPARNSAPAPLERVRDDRMTFDVGRTVKLDGGIRRAMLASGSDRARWKLAQRFIVRGHWRNQVHGEGRALRRRQWIEPFFKGPSDIEEAIQRTYEVQGPKVSP